MGNLPSAEWDAPREVSCFLHFVRYHRYELHRARMCAWVGTPQERTNKRGLHVLMLHNALRMARTRVPNMTTAAHMLQCGIVEKNIAVPAAMQISSGRKRVEIDFAHLRKSKRMQSATTNHLMSFVARGRVPDVVAVGWPLPFANWKHLMEESGGLPGIVNEQEFLRSHFAPTAQGVRSYLLALRRNSPADTAAQGISPKVQAGISQCCALARADAKLAASMRSALWGFSVGQPFFPFDAPELSECWRRVLAFAAQVETEWTAHGLRTMLEESVLRQYAGLGHGHRSNSVLPQAQEVVCTSAVCAIM